MMIEWNNDPAYDPGETIRAVMQICAEKCLNYEVPGINCFLTVRCCGDPEIQSVNAAYRNTDRSTDVLSFPTVSYPAGKTAGGVPDLLKKEYDDERQAYFLGDLLISCPHMAEQAKEYHHSVYREAAYLLVHGVFHLLGYDHMQEEDRRRMRKAEEKVLAQAGILRDNTDLVSDDLLLTLAWEARKSSYSPYSRFPVGAALLCSDGKVYLGCNIENASFGLTNCAERTAVFKAVSEGYKDFAALAIAADAEAWPCGACRQVLNEFAPELPVMISWNNGKQSAKMRLYELLPNSFGPGHLNIHSAD